MQIMPDGNIKFLDEQQVIDALLSDPEAEIYNASGKRIYLERRGDEHKLRVRPKEDVAVPAGVMLRREYCPIGSWVGWQK